jgi:hypothetical protein
VKFEFIDHIHNLVIPGKYALDTMKTFVKNIETQSSNPYKYFPEKYVEMRARPDKKKMMK